MPSPRTAVTFYLEEGQTWIDPETGDPWLLRSIKSDIVTLERTVLHKKTFSHVDLVRKYEKAPR